MFALLWKYSSLFQFWMPKLFNSISGFTTSYPLITTIVGAFVALWLIYILVHVKVYVCPAILYATASNDNGRRHFMWYIENRSIFDAVNMDAAIFKCTRLGDHGIRYDELKLTCSEIKFLTGRWFKGDNKVCLKLKKGQLTCDNVIHHSFSFLEINSTFMHSLSNVITVTPMRYDSNDIYYAKACDESIFTDRSPLPVIELNTLRIGMMKRFMMARKYVTYAILLILSLYLCEYFGLYKTELLNDLGYWILEGLAYVVIIFATVRYLMQLSVDSTIADFPYRKYRVNVESAQAM